MLQAKFNLIVGFGHNNPKNWNLNCTNSFFVLDFRITIHNGRARLSNYESQTHNGSFIYNFLIKNES